MIRRNLSQFVAGLTLALLTTGAPAAETFDDAMQKSLLDYSARQREANAELNSARARIAEEKGPFLRAMRAAENRIITAQTELTRRETEQEQVQDTRQRLVRDAEIRSEERRVGKECW